MSSVVPKPRMRITRNRVYTGLLCFVVLAGLPMLLTPSLRRRLETRTAVLKSALYGEIRPAEAVAGANPAPYPEEFERPMPPMPESQMQRIPSFAHYVQQEAVPAPQNAAPAARKVERVPKSPRKAPALVREKPVDAAASNRSSPEEGDPSAEDMLPYRQGKYERDAYELVLKSNKILAAMVEGQNPDLRFKSWDAAHRGEDIYWVRVTFQRQGKPDEKYIWQVRLSIGEITPLSFNARSIL